VKAWELVAQLDVPFALVAEDDAHFIDSLAAVFANLPTTFDIVFVNERMARHLPGPGCVKVGEALRHVEVFGEGVGADGYLLTPGGATKLLRACETDFYTGHVDWRLARYATMVEERVSRRVTGRGCHPPPPR
jgi:GR25 family glycosyltransferase involved in LPS biosynthesis